MVYRLTAVLCAIGSLVAFSRCSVAEPSPPDSSLQTVAAQFALSSAGLPDCKKNSDGEVWYVWSENKFYVCDGNASTWRVTMLDGLNAAVRVTPLAMGSDCPSAGALVQFGLDRNRNKQLDDDEITTSAKLCNGAMGSTGPQGMAGPSGTPGPQGPSGAQGYNSLIKLSAETAGSNCANGGVKLETGVDTNSNGSLETGEINASQTGYVCDGVSGGNAGSGGGPVECMPCLPGSQECGGACVNLSSDQENCGSCGRACASGTACKAGVCVVSCGAGLTNCAGACVNLASDSVNCGSCGRACVIGTVCTSGVCGLICGNGLTKCAGVCRDLTSDEQNCGQCGTACAAGMLCGAGVCSLSCGGGATACNGLCVDLQNDPKNCGTCGLQCTCTNGQVPVCSAHQCGCL